MFCVRVGGEYSCFYFSFSLCVCDEGMYCSWDAMAFLIIFDLLFSFTLLYFFIENQKRAIKDGLLLSQHWLGKTNLCRPKNSGHGRSLLARVSADRFWYTFFCISEYSMQEHRDYFYCITSPWPQLDVMKDS